MSVATSGCTLVTHVATLDVPRHVVEYLARLLAAHRRRIGAPRRSRASGPFRQAVLVLRRFRDRGCVHHCLARDADVSGATGHHCLNEGIDVLADQAPTCTTSRPAVGARARHTSSSTARPARTNPAHYGETAEAFDAARAADDHLSFGIGVHRCIGVPLARMVARTALSSLFGRFPALAPALTAGDLRQVPSFIAHGWQTVPVRLGA